MQRHDLTYMYNKIPLGVKTRNWEAGEGAEMTTAVQVRDDGLRSRCAGSRITLR